MICSQCQAANEADSAFCAYCGSPLVRQAANPAAASQTATGPSETAHRSPITVGEASSQPKPPAAQPLPTAAQPLPSGSQVIRSGITVGGRRTPTRKLIVAGVVVLLIIVAAIVGSVVSSAESIAVNDCVVTSPSLLHGYDIKKVSCTASEPAGTAVQRVVSVQGGSDGECGFGLTTFQDQPANKTYCLADTFGGG